MFNRFVTIISLILISLLFLSACGDRYISVPYTRPAQVNLKDYNALFIADFKGENGSKIAFELKKQLVDLKRFDILESFYAAHNTSAAAIEGDVVFDTYEEKVKEGSSYKDDKGVYHKEFTVEGKWNSSINFKIIDIKTSKVITALTTDKTTYITRSEKDRKPVIDKASVNKLMNEAHQMIASSIIKLILPTTEYVSVRMMSDDFLPELDKGIDLAKKGDFEGAIEIFRKAIENTKDKEKQAKVYYNIGICYQYNYKFDDARRNFNMAVSLFGEEDLYKEALRKVDNMEKDY